MLIDLERMTWPWVAPEIEPREFLMMRANAGDVDTVLIGGEVVLSKGRPTRFDIDEVGREAARMLNAQAYLSEDAELIERLRPHIEAYYQAWDVPDLEPYTVYNARG